MKRKIALILGGSSLLLSGYCMGCRISQAAHMAATPHKVVIVMDGQESLCSLNDDQYAHMLMLPKWFLWPDKYHAPELHVTAEAPRDDVILTQTTAPGLPAVEKHLPRLDERGDSSPDPASVSE